MLYFKRRKINKISWVKFKNFLKKSFKDVLWLQQFKKIEEYVWNFIRSWFHWIFFVALFVLNFRIWSSYSFSIGYKRNITFKYTLGSQEALHAWHYFYLFKIDSKNKTSTLYFDMRLFSNNFNSIFLIQKLTRVAGSNRVEEMNLLGWIRVFKVTWVVY